MVWDTVRVALHAWGADDHHIANRPPTPAGEVSHWSSGLRILTGPRVVRSVTFRNLPSAMLRTRAIRASATDAMGFNPRMSPGKFKMSTLVFSLLADKRATATIQQAFLAAGMGAAIIIMMHFSGAKKEFERDTSMTMPDIKVPAPTEPGH